MKLFGNTSLTILVVVCMTLLQTALAQDAVETRIVAPPVDDCPKEPNCCEEDCCGLGTSWDGTYCLKDLAGPGFDGVYSSSHNYGCVYRTCCEANCCAENTVYDAGTAECIGVAIVT